MQQAGNNIVCKSDDIFGYDFAGVDDKMTEFWLQRKRCQECWAVIKVMNNEINLRELEAN